MASATHKQQVLWLYRCCLKTAKLFQGYTKDGRPWTDFIRRAVQSDFRQYMASQNHEVNATRVEYGRMQLAQAQEKMINDVLPRLKEIEERVNEMQSTGTMSSDQKKARERFEALIQARKNAEKAGVKFDPSPYMDDVATKGK